MIKYAGLIIVALICTTNLSNAQPTEYYAGAAVVNKNNFTDFCYLKDTLFTLKPYYIEVNLKTQKGYLHSRRGMTKTFDISSGTDRLEDGINTKEGIFVIKAKLPQWYSRQFDSTLMLNWMGFNGGIGFHALPTSGYYHYLGKRKSSHGCIRLSRKTARDLYNLLELGTPVLIHSGGNALTVAFTEPTDSRLFYYGSYRRVYNIVRQKLDALYGGYFFIRTKMHLIIDFNNVGHAGLPPGSSGKILKRQIINPRYRFIEEIIPALIPPDIVIKE